MSVYLSTGFFLKRPFTADGIRKYRWDKQTDSKIDYCGFGKASSLSRLSSVRCVLSGGGGRLADWGSRSGTKVVGERCEVEVKVDRREGRGESQQSSC